ncbi:hypothetical protein RJ639_018879 [Escallonia herrerae]|uniref:Uncharacterized protein n=1 Tax=Escallonia herrerae TaxID=1293975 RepID=A0AA88V764_9ASTE|nr:hypothetical protein RJ639_018879 [Escallonia herrerae]
MQTPKETPYSRAAIRLIPCLQYHEVGLVMKSSKLLKWEGVATQYGFGQRFVIWLEVKYRYVTSISCKLRRHGEQMGEVVSPDSKLGLDVWPHLETLTADVISKTAFGSSYGQGRNIFHLLKEQAELAIEAMESIYIPGYKSSCSFRGM